MHVSQAPDPLTGARVCGSMPQKGGWGVMGSAAVFRPKSKLTLMMTPSPRKASGLQLTPEALPSGDRHRREALVGNPSGLSHAPLCPAQAPIRCPHQVTRRMPNEP